MKKVRNIKLFDKLKFSFRKKKDNGIENNRDRKEQVKNNKNKNKNKNNNKYDKKYDNKKKTIYDKKNPKKNSKYDPKGKKKQKKKKRSFFKKLLTFILIMAIIGVLAVAAFFAYIVLTAPEFDTSNLLVKDQTVIYDINGEVITTLAAEKRESVTYDQLPQVLIDAIIATEDSRFFQHNGVDLFRFIKATIQQLLGHDDAGGASTLTMQIVKNHLTKKKQEESDPIKKIIRKFQDVYLAVFKVEKQYSKEEILEIYANDNGLGSSYYGVEEASKYYFGKSVSDLTLPEAAMIAGLFQAPNRHNPYYDIEKATARRKIVLTLMVRHGYITEEEKEIAEKVPVASLLVGSKGENNQFQGFIDTVVAEVEKRTDPDGDGPEKGDNPYTVPMKIYTTMERSIQSGLDSLYASSDSRYWKDDVVQAGVAVVNVETGAIAAVGAGRNKTGVNQFNFATMAKRQPGSTAKPIFDYGPGVEYNNFSSYQLFNDEPWNYTNGPSVNDWDNKFQGMMTARYAIQVSRNIPALKAFQQVGARNSQKFASSLGLDVSLDASSENYRIVSGNVDNAINEAYSIGGVAEGFTPLEMAAAYAGFASGGYYTEPHSITKIIYRETEEEIEYKFPRTRVMKDSTAYIINNILEFATTDGFDGGARVSGSHVAVKTGTTNFDRAYAKAKGIPSNASNDVWTVAYTSQYSIALWYGYEEASSEHYTTSNYNKEQLMRGVMSYIPKDTTGWTRPSSVVVSEVERDTWPAKLPSEYTPSVCKTSGAGGTGCVLREVFVRGTQPTEVSERFQKLPDVTNIVTKTNNDNSVTLTWDFTTPEVATNEYWQNYFSQSVFGKNHNSVYEERMTYNRNYIGDITFAIYEEQEDGTSKYLTSVKNKSYTYTGNGKVKLVIRTEYSLFKNNASSGQVVELNLAPAVYTGLVLTLNGKNRITGNVGSYTDLGFEKITYNNLDVTNTAAITYSVMVNGQSTNYDTKASLEAYMNSLPAGTYKITYHVTYLTASKNAERTVILRQS